MSAELRAELVAFRRDLHRHPELGRQEFRTTEQVRARLEQAGLSPRVLPERHRAGVRHRPPTDPDRPRLALRADLDALPVPDTKTVPYRSTVEGRAHACGHDVHTTDRARRRTGAGRAGRREGRLPRPVRLVFQPAEEVMPGGALDAVKAGVLDGVDRILARALRPEGGGRPDRAAAGPITSAADKLKLTLDGPGGHSARPHLTTDLVMAAAKLATELPAALDPPGRPALRAEHRVGPDRGRARGERHPAARRAGGHRPLPGPGRLARGAGPGARGDRPGRRDLPGQVRDHLPARGAAGGQRGRLGGAAARRDDRPLGRARASRTPSRASAARTSPGTSSMCPARSPGSAYARSATRPSVICTRATSTSTRAPSRSAWSSSRRLRCCPDAGWSPGYRGFTWPKCVDPITGLHPVFT